MQRVRRELVPVTTPLDASINLSYTARRVLLASYWYYGLSESYISDGEYDDLSYRLATAWNLLDDVTRYKFDSRRALRATGSHFLFSHQDEGGARAAYKAKFGGYPKWKLDKWRKYKDLDGLELSGF